MRWNEARARFKSTLKRSQAALAEVEAIRKAIEALPTAHTKARVVDKAAEIADALVTHWGCRPGFWSRLFLTRTYKQWLAREEGLRGHAVRSAELAGVEQSIFADLHVGRRIAAGHLSKNLTARAAIAGAEARRIQEVATAGSLSLGSRIIDTRFFERSHEERHLEPPWLSDVAHRARDELFVASVALHKAFIDAAAKPLRNNLGALMGALSGRALGSPEKDALLSDLWASLFLVVPVISTTFASVNRMLGALPPQALGWLLIDEAGQALPQAAVGALLRTRRAVVVGDPMQIEPVVMLPETLTGTICRHFGVDPDSFNAPSGSVQTLADAATPYSAEFPNRTGNRTVGVPLLVHRRCREPMFGVSNAVAYERLMVFGTPTRASPIREVLGPSRWINVVGGDQERWCPEEGEIVCQMLAKLKSSGIEPDIYIVTPFVMVQEGMRRAVLDSGLLNGWVKEEAWRWVQERIGTVHTVQGREAEAVILILGAQHPSRNGARGWAGGRPNLLNVAVTRAQEVLYVIGNRSLWKVEGYFKELHGRLPASEED